MGDNSDTPITVSEVPPQKQLSPLSFFARLAGQSSSKKSSPDPSKRILSSPSKTFVQTPLDPWIERSSSKRSESPEESLPPWATPRTNVEQNQQNQQDQQDLSFSIDSLPLEIEEEDSYSIPEYEPEASQQDKDDFSILDSQDIIGPPDYPEDESEPYCTPLPHLSPESNLPEPVPEEYCSFFDNNENADQHEYNDNDSQATAPYNVDGSPSAESNDSEYFQATSPYNPNDSQLTVPYNYDDNTQTTAPYDPNYDSLETPPCNVVGNSQITSARNANQSLVNVPYFSESSQHSCGPSNMDSEIPAPYTPIDNSLLEVVLSPNKSEHNSPQDSSPRIHSSFDDDDLAAISSPNYPDELFKLLIEQYSDKKSSAPGIDQTEKPNTELEKNLKRSASPTTSKHYVRESSIESVNLVSPTKQQKLNIDSLGSSTAEEDRFSSNEDSIKSQESISAQQRRSSTVKKSVPIENYFLGSSFGSTTQEESQSDIGRVSTTPSFRYNNEDIKKEEKQTPIVSADRRRRPRFGLSRNLSK